MGLSYHDHDRDSAGLTYVYPVLSRRSGGVSIGINLNPNHACNWRCIYCQVPNLVRGGAPRIDLSLLEKEFSGFLREVTQGEFYQRSGLTPEQQQICDIAFSGNGEPTSSKDFDAVVELLQNIMAKFDIYSELTWVLITNGSLMDRGHVQRGLARLAQVNARIWFKIDSLLPEEQQRINQVLSPPEPLYRHLEIAARFCPVWIQTCLFAIDGEPPSTAARQAYINFLADLPTRQIEIAGVLLYGLARSSKQPEAGRLSSLTSEEFRPWASAIGKLGLPVTVTT